MYTVLELTQPTTSTPSPELAAAQALWAALTEAAGGHPGTVPTAASYAATWSTYEPGLVRRLIVRDGEENVAGLDLVLSPTIRLSIGSLPGHGEALQLAWDQAAELLPAGRPVTCTLNHRIGSHLGVPGTDIRLESTDASAFLAGVGFEQTGGDVESWLDLGVDMEELKAGVNVDKAYRMIQWAGPIPESYTDQMIDLHNAFERSIGSQSVHTTDSVRAFETNARGEGRKLLTTAAAHVGSGTLVGMTRLSVFADKTVVIQDDTFVDEHHRRQGLALRMKVANLLYLRSLAPESTHVITWNSGTNEAMRSINERLGFAPAAGKTTWRRPA